MVVVCGGYDLVADDNFGEVLSFNEERMTFGNSIVAWVRWN